MTSATWSPHMKATLILSLILAAVTPLGARAQSTPAQTIPAGSLIVCTISEAKISSRTEAAGDPILCRVNRVLPYSDTTVPIGLMVQGQVCRLQGPGPSCGQGLDGARLRPPLYPWRVGADQCSRRRRREEQGGYRWPHPGQGPRGAPYGRVADPLALALDLINLPRRGPLPQLKAESKITMKVMSDFVLPETDSFPYT